MKRILSSAAMVLCALSHALTQAQMVERQDPAAILAAAEKYLSVQTTGLPGKVTYTLGALDPRVALPACPALEIFLPAGARLWGATSLGVRCNGATPWSIYLTANIRVVGEYLVSARPLAQGQVLSAVDFVAVNGDLTQLPATTLTNSQQAMGKTVAANLAAGQPLRQDMLRSPLVVQQGQSVKLQSVGKGFVISTEGKALNNAQEGQVVQVRTASGQTVSGIARPMGVIEVRF